MENSKKVVGFQLKEAQPNLSSSEEAKIAPLRLPSATQKQMETIIAKDIPFKKAKTTPELARGNHETKDERSDKTIENLN